MSPSAGRAFVGRAATVLLPVKGFEGDLPPTPLLGAGCLAGDGDRGCCGGWPTCWVVPGAVLILRRLALVGIGLSSNPGAFTFAAGLALAGALFAGDAGLTDGF